MIDSDSSRLGSPIVQCTNLHVAFPGSGGKQQTVLQGLDLNIVGGSVVSLLGASGCGKSTLLRVVAGLIQPNSGHVHVDGQSAFSEKAPIRQQMSFVFQEPALLPWRSVWENTLLPLELRGQHRSDKARESVRHWLRVVGLNESDWSKRPHQLSGGMKMRASIARAMTTKPRILLMDEPFAALDDVLRSKLNDLILAIAKEENCTVLFVTHNIAEAVYISHSISVMDTGRIVESIPVNLPFPRTSQLRRSSEFANMYGIVSDSLFRNVA